MMEDNIDKEQNQLDNDEVEPQSKRRRISRTPNDEDNLFSPITSEHNAGIADLQIDELEEGTINDEFDFCDMVNCGENRDYSDWQQFEQEVNPVNFELIDGDFDFDFDFDLSKIDDRYEQRENSDFRTFEPEVKPANFESEHVEIPFSLQIYKVVDNNLKLEYSGSVC